MKRSLKSLLVEIVSFCPLRCIAPQTIGPDTENGPQGAASPVVVHTLPVPHRGRAQHSQSVPGLGSHLQQACRVQRPRVLHHRLPPPRALLQSVGFAGELKEHREGK